jgi:hypothetical protein
MFPDIGMFPDIRNGIAFFEGSQASTDSLADKRSNKMKMSVEH